MADFFKSASHKSVAEFMKRADGPTRFGGVTMGVRIELDLKPLARALKQVAEDAQDTAIVRGINTGVQRDLHPSWTKRLQTLTRLRQKKRIAKAFKDQLARKGTLRGSVIVKDRFMRITTAYFGAKYSVRGKYGKPGGKARHGIKWGPQGVTHQAWNRPQMPPHTFMIPGLSPVFIRAKYLTGGHHQEFTPKGKREAIAPIFGPSLPKELQRHSKEAVGDIRTAISRTVMPEINRQIELAMRKAKAKNRL